MITDTSRKAYENTRHSNFCEWERETIRRMLKKRKTGLTGREMAERMGVELYKLRPRITQLKDRGIIIDSGSRKSYTLIINNKKRKQPEIVWILTDFGRSF